MHKVARTLLIATVTLLLIYGISMLYSTSYAVYGESLLKRQLLWIAAGSMCAAALWWRLDYRRLGRYSWWGLGIFAALLLYLALANVMHQFRLAPGLLARLPFIGGLSKGSPRWIRLWKVSLQPSEFAKLAIIVFLSNYLPRHTRHTRELLRGFLKPMVAVGFVAGLILLGGDLSSTAITGCVIFGLAFVGGVRLRYLFIIVLAGLVMAGSAIKLSPERISRITSYRNPEAVQDTDGYQLWHSQLALGSGGWRGLGFTNSRMKRYYLPEAHTDFIVAIIGEELGYLGIASLVILYAGLMVSVFWLAGLAADREGMLVCTGVAMLLGLQALVNVSVVSGFCPTTGVTAPFLSYGGSSIVASLLGIGLALSVSRVSEQDFREAHMQAGGNDMASEPPYRQRLRASARRQGTVRVTEK